MLTGLLPRLDGISLTVDRHLCQMMFAGWRRTNRNNRIAKKWRKRYGHIAKCRSVRAYRFGGGLIVCPHVMEKLIVHTDRSALTEESR